MSIPPGRLDRQSHEGSGDRGAETAPTVKEYKRPPPIARSTMLDQRSHPFHLSSRPAGLADGLALKSAPRTIYIRPTSPLEAWFLPGIQLVPPLPRFQRGIRQVYALDTTRPRGPETGCFGPRCRRSLTSCIDHSNGSVSSMNSLSSLDEPRRARRASASGRRPRTRRSGCRASPRGPRGRGSTGMIGSSLAPDDQERHRLGEVEAVHAR